jgi:hypothetical protein
MTCSPTTEQEMRYDRWVKLINTRVWLNFLNLSKCSGKKYWNILAF